MDIKRDWSISFDEKEYIALVGDSFARLLQNPSKLDTFQAALKEMEEAIKPAACWDRFPIQKLLHDKLVLADGVRIGGGPVVSVVGGAEELIVAVCTVSAPSKIAVPTSAYGLTASRLGLDQGRSYAKRGLL